jgi:hypothetical protein
MKKFYSTILALVFILTAANVAVLDDSKVTGYRITGDSENYLEVDFSVGELTYSDIDTEKGVFTKLEIENGYVTRNEGSPALPAMHEMIAMPYGAEPSVEVISYDKKVYSLKELGIENPVFPAQPSYSKSSKPEDIKFIYNEVAYMSSKFNDGVLAEVSKSGTMRGVGVGVLKVYPFKYNPAEGTVEVYNDLKVRVNFIGADPRAEQIQSESYSPYFESAYSQMINYKPSSVKADLMTWPVTYLIVASDVLSGNADLQRLIDWKTEKGFKVIVEYVSSSASISANDGWVETQYSSLNPKPSFLLLVGDLDGTYAVQSNQSSPLGGSNVETSDLEYGVMGAVSSSNRVPSIYVGRYSVRTTGDLTAQVDKTIWYEKEQFTTSADLSYLTRTLGCAGVDASFSASHGDPHISYGWTHYFTSANGMPNADYYLSDTSDLSSTAGEIVSFIDAGANFYNYTAHGMPTYFAEPGFYISDIDGLTNTGEYPLVVGNCCLTNTFNNTEAFGEAWLNAPNKGAIGYIGASMSTYWDEDLAMGVGTVATNQVPPALDTANPGMYDGAMALGYSSQAAVKHVGLMAVEALNTGYTDDYWGSYHLMGDPSVQIYFGIPSEPTASHDGVMAPGATSFAVNTDPGAYVGMTDQNGVLHGAARADGSGVANVTIDPYTVGDEVNIVITNQFIKPYFSTIMCTGETGGTFSYTPASISYGSVSLGSSLLETFQISNSHNSEYLMGEITTIAGYTVSLASKSLTEAPVKDLKNTMSYSVAPQSSKTFNLIFEPTGSATYNGNITITSTDTNHATEYLAVTGTGIAPDINLNPVSLSATTTPGTSVNKIFAVENTDLGTLNYSMSINYTGGKEIKASGGPDTFGYKWKDSDEVGGPVYSWVDITGSGSTVSLGDDAYSSAVNLGFTFNFYGVDYTNVKICSNGFLSFTSTATAYTNGNIPDTATPNDILALFWDDLNPTAGGSIYYYADTANGRFIVSYIGVPHYGTTSYNTGQVIIYSSGKIVYQYQEVGASTVNTCTVGIENVGGTDGSLVIKDAAYLKANFAIQFQATPEWLSLSSTSGSITGVGSDNITATCDATDLEAGVYTADIMIGSNDPDEATVVLPVTFTVSDQVLPPSAPVLASPANAGSTTDQTPAFDWNDVSGAESYTILVDNNSNFGSPEIDQNPSVSTYTPGTALAYGTYYWKVLATNSAGSSAYSDTWTLTIEAPQFPDITVSAAQIDTAAEPEGTDTDSFNIGNTGTADLNYTISQEYVIAKADITVHSNDFASGLGSYAQDGVDIVWAGTGGQAVLNANTGGNPNGNAPATLTSDSFDGTQCTGLTLTFDQSFTTAGESSISVDYYDGTSWAQIYSSTSTTTASQSLTLPNISANMQIRFTGTMKNRSGDSWTVDNIVVYGPESGPGYSWLTINSSLSGTVVPAGSSTINLTCDAAGLTANTYNANITVDSDDPDEPSVVIPVVFVVSSTTPPSAPENISVVTATSSQVDLSWDAVTGATMYHIYRSTTDPYSGFALYDSTSGTTYQDTNVSAGNKYFYYITSDNAK